MRVWSASGVAGAETPPPEGCTSGEKVGASPCFPRVKGGRCIHRASSLIRRSRLGLETASCKPS